MWDSLGIIERDESHTTLETKHFGVGDGRVGLTIDDTNLERAPLDTVGTLAVGWQLRRGLNDPTFACRGPLHVSLVGVGRGPIGFLRDRDRRDGDDNKHGED